MRRNENEYKELVSYKSKIGSEAKLILALQKRQPQTAEDIYKSADISISTFYRIRPLLMGAGIIRKHRNGYVLYDFNELDDRVDEALKKFKEKGYVTVGLSDLAIEVGKPPEMIRESAFKFLKKYGIILGEESEYPPSRPIAKSVI